MLHRGIIRQAIEAGRFPKRKLSPRPKYLSVSREHIYEQRWFSSSSHPLIMGWEHGACAEALSFGKQHLAAGGEGKAERSLPQRASHTPSSPCSFSPGLVLPTPSCGHGGIHGPSPLPSSPPPLWSPSGGTLSCWSWAFLSPWEEGNGNLSMWRNRAALALCVQLKCKETLEGSTGLAFLDNLAELCSCPPLSCSS